MRFKTEKEGLQHIKGKSVRDVNYIKNPAAKKQMPDSEEGCRVDFERWTWAKRFMFSPEELQSLLGEDHRGHSGTKRQDVRNHHVNTFVDWAEDRPRRRAIIVIDENQKNAATQIVKKVDILGGDNTFNGVGLSPDGNEPASHLWCGWNCSASEYEFFEKQTMPWWQLFDGQETLVEDILTLLNLKKVVAQHDK